MEPEANMLTVVKVDSLTGVERHGSELSHFQALDVMAKPTDCSVIA